MPLAWRGVCCTPVIVIIRLRWCINVRDAPPVVDDPDAELVARVGRQDAAAGREIVARKLPRLLSLATRMLGDREEARDVAQDVFVRVWKEASRWQPGAARFDTWLHRVALNLCYDRLRKRRRDDPTSVEDLPERPDPDALPEERLMAADRHQRIQLAMAGLPVRQREALVLQYYQELSNVEAADLMGISVDALESLLSRARRGLRQALNGDADGDVIPKKERP